MTMISFPSLEGQFSAQQPLIVQPSPSCFSAYLALWQDPGIWQSFRLLLFSIYGSLEWQIIISIIIIIIILLANYYFYYYYHTPCHWSLRDSKGHQVSRALFSILGDFNNSVVRMFLARSLISNSSSPLYKPLGTVPSAPITTSITVNFMFHSFLVIWQGPSFYFFFRFHLLSLCVPMEQQKLFWQVIFFFVIYHDAWSSNRG